MLIADAGIPMIAGFLPTMWLALIPVILLEAAIGVRVTKISFRQAAGASTIANGVSTLIGIPLTWVILAIIEGAFFGQAQGLNSFTWQVYAVTVQAPWLIPYEKDLFWMVPIAVIVLAIAFWGMSVLIEYFVVRRVLPTLPPADIWRWMWKGNLASYLLLPLLALPLGIALPSTWFHRIFDPVTDLLCEIVFKVWQLF